jgi:hypothetical protein
MEKLIYILCICILALGCSKGDVPVEEETDPCSLVVDGVYMFPTEKPDSTLTKEEIKEYWNIPEDVLGCITTEGLIKSCYKTIYGVVIEASNGYQSGYKLLKGWCRGFDELERRHDAPAALISYFKSKELPHTLDYNLYAIEIASAQDSILKRFTKEQKIEMLNMELNYHAERREIFNRNSIIHDGTIVFMGRLMVFDKNAQFLQSLERNEEINSFMEGTGKYILSLAGADTIVHYTEDYLFKLNYN